MFAQTINSCHYLSNSYSLFPPKNEQSGCPAQSYFISYRVPYPFLLFKYDSGHPVKNQIGLDEAPILRRPNERMSVLHLVSEVLGNPSPPPSRFSEAVGFEPLDQRDFPRCSPSENPSGLKVQNPRPQNISPISLHSRDIPREISFKSGNKAAGMDF